MGGNYGIIPCFSEAKCLKRAYRQEYFGLHPGGRQFDPGTAHSSRQLMRAHLRAGQQFFHRSLRRQAFPTSEAVMKLLYMTLLNISRRWTMPLQDWSKL
jgi:hypothetical protein